MQSKTPSVKQSHIDAGDGVHLSVIQARGAVRRRGMIKVLMISTALAVVAIGGSFAFSLLSKPPSSPTPVRASSAAVAQADTLRTRTWDSRHLEAGGLEKCRAFRKVVTDTTGLQTAGGGTISQVQRTGLEAELKAAKAMPPASLTPFQCGVAL